MKNLNNTEAELKKRKKRVAYKKKRLFGGENSNP